MSPATAVNPLSASIWSLSAPLYAGWQLTNECNLACLHCLEESGPGRASGNELSSGEIFRVTDGLIEAAIPYVSLSGGEPMLHPHFFEIVRRLAGSGAGVKIETNGHYLTPGNAKRLKAFGVKAVQVSVDGAGAASYEKLRARGSFKTVVAGLENLRSAGVPLEINFVPSGFNIHEIGEAVDMALEWGATGFYTGRLIYAGNADRARGAIAPREEDYAGFFSVLHAKAAQYSGRMRVRFHELGILEEVRCRLQNPAAILIILPDGRVKLMNALPFICGDLRTQTPGEVWRKFQKGWKNPRVARFARRLGSDPGLLSGLHKWITL